MELSDVRFVYCNVFMYVKYLGTCRCVACNVFDCKMQSAFNVNTKKVTVFGSVGKVYVALVHSSDSDITAPALHNGFYFVTGVLFITRY